MRLSMNLNADLLHEAELEKIVQSAVRILRRVPFRIQGTDEFMDYLSTFGCPVDGEQVWFPDRVVDVVLKRISEQKRQWLAANRTHDDSPNGAITMHTHGQSLLACDVETNRLRAAVKADLEVWCRVVDSFGDLGRSHPTFVPTDVPVASSDFHTYATIILNSREPHRVSVYSAKMLPFFVEASVIAQGSLEAVKKSTVFAAKIWVNTPFMITRENVDIAMDARRLLGQPIQLGTMPVAGTASPVTVSGTLAQSTAEVIAMNAVSLAVDDALCGYTASPIVLDMRALSHRQFGPDVVLHHYANSQMGAYLFGGRPRIAAMNVGAPVVSAQSVYEKAISTMLYVAAGGRDLGIGSLATSDVGSLVQLTLDYETGCFFRHLLRDVKVDPEHLDEDAIVEMAPRGAYYMASDNTAKFFREESWLPAFCDFRNALAWQSDPSDMIDRARDRARQLCATAENQCPLTDGQKKEMQKLMAAADRAAGDSHGR